MADETFNLTEGATPTPEGAKATEGEGKATEREGDGWTAILPKEYREKYAEQLKEFNKPRDLFDHFLELKEKVGKAIFVPAEDADEDTKKAYRKAVGVPEDGKYNLPQLSAEEKELLGDGADFESWFKATANRTELTQSQAEAFYSLYIKANAEKAKERAEAQRKESESRTDALNKLWGSKTTENFELAKRTFAKYATPEFVAWCVSNKLDTHPEMVQVFYNIALRTADDRGTSSTIGGEQKERKGLHYDSLNKLYPPED